MSSFNKRSLRSASALFFAAVIGGSAAGAPAPPAFDVGGRTPLLVVHAEGAQLYECKPAAGGFAWTFREPIAALIKDGRTIGRHYAGPTWELDDGGAVRGKVAASAPGATDADVPLLELNVVEHHGAGALKDAVLVLRLATHGGVLSGACPVVGELQAAPYSADYVFLP